MHVAALVQFCEIWPVDRHWKHNLLSLILVALASGSSLASVGHFLTGCWRWQTKHCVVVRGANGVGDGGPLPCRWTFPLGMGVVVVSCVEEPRRPLF